MTTALQENLTGMRVVRTFARQSQELEKFTALNKDYRAKVLRLNNLMGVYWGSSDIMGYLQIALVMLAGIYLAVQGEISLGTVMLFSTYSSMLTFPMRQLGRILADLVKADVSLKRLDEILTAPQEEEPGKALTPPIHGKVEFRDVSFAYPDGGEILHHVDFTVEPGQTIGILGNTGSGKSTLLYLLSGLYEPDNGQIADSGGNVLNQLCLRRSVTLLEQDGAIFSGTVASNLFSEEMDRAKCILDALGFGKELQYNIEPEGKNLSPGERKKIPIARALLRDAPFLVLDEPLNHLDKEGQAALEAMIEGRQGVIIVSHRNFGAMGNAQSIAL